MKPFLLRLLLCCVLLAAGAGCFAPGRGVGTAPDGTWNECWDQTSHPTSGPALWKDGKPFDPATCHE